MPSPVLRLLLLHGAILPRRTRPLFPMDEYIVAAPIPFIFSVEVAAPDAILPAVLVFHVAPREQAGRRYRQSSRFLGIP